MTTKKKYIKQKWRKMCNQQTIKNEEEKSGEYDTIRIKISEETSCY